MVTVASAPATATADAFLRNFISTPLNQAPKKPWVA
jgi:hypothetical protein